MACTLRYLCSPETAMASSIGNLDESRKDGSKLESNADTPKRRQWDWAINTINEWVGLMQGTIMGNSEIRHRFLYAEPFDERVEELQEAFVTVAGSEKNPLKAKDVKRYLELIFEGEKITDRHTTYIMTLMDLNGDRELQWDELYARLYSVRQAQRSKEDEQTQGVSEKSLLR